MNPILSVSVLLLSAISIVDFHEKQETFRTNNELCQEVAEEVNLQVEAGLVTQDEADRISQRCFALFVQ